MRQDRQRRRLYAAAGAIFARDYPVIIAATASVSPITSRMTRAVSGWCTSSSSVAPVSALIGLKATLPRSLTQISWRKRVVTGQRDGTIHQLVRLKWMCRHTVGLNYTAIGIEHVGRSDAEVLRNARQMNASLKLTLWLAASMLTGAMAALRLRTP